ncbi:MAG: hypothetical protein U9Q03_01405 [Patescibacteria group bacterium]|nr:hypothetical protein [Patescibacteria group bacterium]
MRYSKKRKNDLTGKIRKCAGGFIVAGVVVYAVLNSGSFSDDGPSDEPETAAFPPVISTESGEDITEEAGDQVAEDDQDTEDDSSTTEKEAVATVPVTPPAPLPEPVKLSPEAKLADCLTASGARLYGAEWCHHCQTQKAAFGDAVGRVNYIECADKSAANGQATACRDARIASYPTWIFGDGSRVTGNRPMWELARNSGCEWEG